MIYVICILCFSTRTLTTFNCYSMWSQCRHVLILFQPLEGFQDEGTNSNPNDRLSEGQKWTLRKGILTFYDCWKYIHSCIGVQRFLWFYTFRAYPSHIKLEKQRLATI
jgi:hypothetical protein